MRLKRPRIIFIAAAFLLFAVCCAAAVNRYYPVKYSEFIKQSAGRLDHALILAVIHAESKFRPEAVSSKGAIGLMQVTEATAEWMASLMEIDDYKREMLTDPEINIAIGCYFLNWLSVYYPDELELALCAYNAGLGNVNRWLADERYSIDGESLQVIPFAETEQYIKRVANNKIIYKFLLFFGGGL